MSISEQLLSCALFHDLTEAEIDFLLKGAEVITADKGIRLYREGDQLDHFFIVLEGSASINKNLNTKMLEVQRLKKMDHFGELIFSNDFTYPFEIISETYFTAVKISFERFQLMYKKKPEAYGIFMMNLLRMELEKSKISLGLISRIYTEGSKNIGVPLFGNRRLSEEEKIQKRQRKLFKKRIA